MATTDQLLKVMSRGGALAGTGVGGGGGGGGGITGAAPRSYNAASGGIPGVTSPVSTVTGNLGSLSDIINSLTQTSSGALKGQYPSEYFSVLGTLLGNTQRRASGDISDLLPELQQGAAESAVAGGVSGSGAANSKLLRDLGLTRYGVENQALKDLATIQGEIPTVRPFDPNDIIRQQLEAQERADMYAAAPSPEAAYQRAMQAAQGGGGGPSTGWKSGGVTYAPSGGGGWGTKPASPWNSSGPLSIAPQSGSAMNPFGGPTGLAPAPYGSINYAGGNIPGSYGGGGQDNFDDILSLWNDEDFGGSLNYGGGAPWDSGIGTDIFGTGVGQDYSGGGFNEWLTTDYDPQYADAYDYYGE